MTDEQIAELQYEAGMYQSLYENAAKVLGEINHLVRIPTSETNHRTAERHFQADFDKIRKLTAPFAFPSGIRE